MGVKVTYLRPPGPARVAYLSPMRTLLFLSLFCLLLACGEGVPPPPAMPPLADLPLIPRPVEMSSWEGYLYVDPEAERVGGDAGAEAYLAGRGLVVPPVTTMVDSALSLPAGSYSLTVSPDSVIINAADSAGAFNAYVTLGQLIAFSPTTDRGLFLPAGTVTDMPRYAYRGVMLDVARHFFGVDSVKQFIDRVVPYKINHLHLHLSDDQGWRIEIESWPKLATVGGRYEVDGTTGGYYTQEDYREIVRYAAARGVTVVPEIDLPGHTHAALVAYPELSVDGATREPYFGTDVGFSTLDASKEATYRFIDDVIRELAAITPGPFLHVGGDESDVTPHDDYVKMIVYAQEAVGKYGKRVIGWDEMATAGIKGRGVLQLWRHKEYARQAWRAGHQIIFSPANRTYLDMQYDSTSRIGLHWAAFIEVDSAYLWDPDAMIPDVRGMAILGVEAPLWTETVRSTEDIDYLVFPRLLALAEVMWTPQPRRDYQDFLRRLRAHQVWLKEQGVGTYDTRVLVGG